jgi:hypothetical protein
MTFSSVQFGTNNQIVNDDIADHVHPNNVLPDSQRHTVGIRVNNTRETFRFQQNGGPVTATPKVTSVQLQQPTGLVRVPGTPHEVTPAVLEKMRETSPEAFLEPEAKAAKQAEAADAEADAANEAAAVEELNRFVDPAAEAAS